MAYQLVLLDFDGTLIDFQKAQAAALEYILEKYGVEYTPENLKIYMRINDAYWAALEQGRVAKNRLSDRFRDFLKEIGRQDVDFHEMNLAYLEALPDHKVLYPEAENVCKAISRKADIIIATNGAASGQMRAIKNSAIAPYIKAVAVSELAGYPKPDIRFFQYAVNLASPVAKEKILMVGDSLSADIAGGMGFGIDTCWFNPHMNKKPDDINPTYTIHKLSDLPDII